MRLEIISDHKDLPPACRSFAFGGTGGTIGRGLDNDWILPDPDRFISNHHARIDCVDGLFYIVDTSTNGVYLNRSRKPVAQGEPQKLRDGDMLLMGKFRIHVSVDETIEPRGARDSGTWTIKTGDSTTAKQPPVKLSVVESSNVMNFARKPAPQHEPVAPQSAEASPKEVTCGGTSSLSRPVRMQFSEQVLRERVRLMTAFFEGLGLEAEEMDFDRDPVKTFRDAGNMLGAFIGSTMRMLGNRSSIKGHFRLDQTTVLPDRNNPLKITDNSHQATRQLLSQTGNRYVGPVDAVKEAMFDLDQHNKAVVAGMQAAFDAYIADLDPDELEAGFDDSLGRSGLFRKVKGMQYWSMYKELYPVLTGRSPGHFPEAFVREFVRAYEHYLEEHRPPPVKQEQRT
jgi:type VI secretion system protein